MRVVAKDAGAMDEDADADADPIAPQQSNYADEKQNESGGNPSAGAFELSQLLFTAGKVAIKQIVFLELTEHETKRSKLSRRLVSSSQRYRGCGR